MNDVNRRRFIEGGALLALAPYIGEAFAQQVPRSSFAADATAEQVTAGIDMGGKTVVVTGCNSGIGLETMRVLALRGAHVIGTARSLERGQEACASVARSRDAGRARARAISIRWSRAPIRFARLNVRSTC